MLKGKKGGIITFSVLMLLVVPLSMVLATDTPMDTPVKEDLWESFSSCNQIGKVLQTIPIEDHELDPISTRKVETFPHFIHSQGVIFDKEDFISLYQPQKNHIILVKSPKSSHNPVMNILTPEVFGIIKFSKNFSNIQMERYENLLIITAHYKDNTVMMIYRIDEKKIIPMKYFQIEGQLLDTKIIQNKFYFATQKGFPGSEIRDYKEGRKKISELIPHFLEDKDFLKISTVSKEIDCRMVKFPDQNINALGASFISVVSTDLKALTHGSQVASFFGNIETLVFEDKFMYTFYHLDQGAHKALVLDQFVLEPIVSYMNSYHFFGNLISDQNFYNLSSQKLLGLQYSGETKLLKIDDQFSLFRNVPLGNKGTYFFDKKYFYLVREDVVELWVNNAGTMVGVGVFPYMPEEQLWYLLSADDNTLYYLTVGNDNKEKLYFKIIAIKHPDVTTCTHNNCVGVSLEKELLSVAYYSGYLDYDMMKFSNLAFINTENNQFYFPLKLRNGLSEDLLFNGLKALKFINGEQFIFEEALSRNYLFYLGEGEVATLNNGDEFIAASASGFFDLFVTNIPQRMKVLGF